MANGENCINCGCMESYHAQANKEWHNKPKSGYEYSPKDCPGFESR